jgi:hypothetical protein
MERVKIDLGPEFASGLTPIALSWAKTFGGLRLLPLAFDLD